MHGRIVDTQQRVRLLEPTVVEVWGAAGPVARIIQISMMNTDNVDNDKFTKDRMLLLPRHHVKFNSLKKRGGLV